MAEVTIPIADVDESVSEAKPGETVEVYATLKIKSKTDSEVVAEISDVEKCEDMEADDSMDTEDYSEDAEPSEDATEGEPSSTKPMKSKGKGMGVLIMIGGSKKK
jgi:hypothetical protein